MTEKRFTLEEFGLSFIVNDNGRNLTAKQTVDGLNQLYEENEELKETLGAILLEVKQDISIRNQTGEIKVFINPNRFELISEVLKKYGALKEWYNE